MVIYALLQANIKLISALLYNTNRTNPDQKPNPINR
jgi:hypothetical protein